MKIREAVNKLLLVEKLLKNEKSAKKGKYLLIKKGLESKALDTEKAFLINNMPVFKELMAKFQGEEPMIYLSLLNCKELVKKNNSQGHEK